MLSTFTILKGKCPFLCSAEPRVNFVFFEPRVNFKDTLLCFPGSSAGEESACNAGDPGLIPGSGRSPGRMDRLPTPVFWGMPGGSAGTESTCNVGDLSSVPGLGRSPGEGKGYPLQYYGLENSTDCIVHGVA